MPIVNGTEIKNVRQLQEKLRKDPTLGRCTLRAEATFDGAFKSEVIAVPAFRGSGGECLYAEELLEVLAKCVTFDTLAYGQHQGLQVGSVQVAVEGDIDFAGSADLGGPAAFKQIRVNIEVDADATDQALAELAATVRRVSVVGQSLQAVPQDWSLLQVVAA